MASFVNAGLRGAGQVFFQDNPWSGLLILAGVFWGAYAGGNPAMAWGALVGLISATATAMMLGAEPAAVEHGLLGLNGILVGVAIPLFAAHTPAMWVEVVLGGIVSAVMTQAISDLLQRLGVSGSTAPFVFTTWLLLLAGYALARLPVLPANTLAAEPIWSLAGVALTLARNISQVYLIGNAITGVLFLVAIAINCRRSAVFALGGSVVGLVVATGLGANPAAISAGLYGFSAVLTAMAVGVAFNPPSKRVTAYALVATIFTVLVQAALNTALLPLRIPALTFPYVLTMWIFQIPKAKWRRLA